MAPSGDGVASPSYLSPGIEVAGHRIGTAIGRGGMGVVYLAEDIGLKRKVALKLLSPGLAQDEGFRKRFLEESELAASLDHPNVVPISEAGEAEQGLFIAMRYVEGGDLRERLRACPLAPAEAAEPIGKLGDALDAAHGRGLVHGDVKPSNALLSTGAGSRGLRPRLPCRLRVGAAPRGRKSDGQPGARHDRLRC